jgi:hypothetical protein
MMNRAIFVGALFATSLLLPACRDSGPKIEIAEDAEPWQVGIASVPTPGADGGLREEPSAESKVLQQYDPDDEVYILEEKGEWSRVADMSNPKKPVVGWMHISCIRPWETEEVYRTWLSAQDHSSSKGAPISKAVVILRQDRANVHKFGKPDAGDTKDSWFGNKSMRADLVNGRLQVFFDEGAEEIIENWTPYVQVVLSEPTVSVSILEKGAPLAAPPQAKKKRKKPDEKAVGDCVGKWCYGEDGPLCEDGEGDYASRCPGLIKCLRKAGQSKRQAVQQANWCFAG